MLINEGPSLKALVPAPLYQGMRDGKIVRFEEITRAPLEVQDCLLGMLSDRVMTIPELNDDHNLLYAQEGFNIIGTANTRDRGVNEMSAALKRRFDFETVFPIMDFQQELDLVATASNRLLEKSGGASYAGFIQEAAAFLGQVLAQELCYRALSTSSLAANADL